MIHVDMIRVPINIPLLGRQEMTQVNKVLRSGVLTSADRLGGPQVQEFEQESCRLFKSKYAVAVNSGTAALQAALHAVGIGPGDEVILPSFTFVATANAVASVGARPVFADIGSNYTLDETLLPGYITKKTRAIIPVHLYGNVCRMDAIMRIARDSGLHVIEDAAQSMGSQYRGKESGTIGHLGCFSLYPAKVMTSGEGGLVLTGSKKLYEKLLMVRNHGMVAGYDSRIFGLNLRMPEIHAAIAKVQARRLDSFLKARRRNARLLSEMLEGADVATPYEEKHQHVNWYLYTVSTSCQGRLKKELNLAGYGANVYYPIPVHRIPFYMANRRLPVTDWASKHVLSIPIHPQVTQKDLAGMARIIKQVA